MSDALIVSDREEYVTICFKCDIRKVAGNPFDLDTPYGKAVIIGVGDIFAERDELEKKLEEARRA